MGKHRCSIHPRYPRTNKNLQGSPRAVDCCVCFDLASRTSFPLVSNDTTTLPCSVVPQVQEFGIFLESTCRRGLGTLGSLRVRFVGPTVRISLLDCGTIPQAQLLVGTDFRKLELIVVIFHLFVS